MQIWLHFPTSGVIGMLPGPMDAKLTIAGNLAAWMAVAADANLPTQSVKGLARAAKVSMWRRGTHHYYAK